METYERKHLIGYLLTGSEGESMITIVRTWQHGGRQGAGVVAKGLHFISKLEAERGGEGQRRERKREREIMPGMGTSESSKPTRSGSPPLRTKELSHL